MAEQNGFLNIGDGAIPGVATVTGFEGQVVVLGIAYDIDQAGEWEEGDQLTGRVTSFGSLRIDKAVDKGSPAMALACAMKTQYDTAELALVAGGDAYYTITLEKVLIAGVSVSYNAGDVSPRETVELKYRKGTWRHGTATTSYDLAQNSEG